jgi:hypothetical protein
MAKKLYEESDIQAIADAIREKTGDTTTYTVAEMGGEISSNTIFYGLFQGTYPSNGILVDDELEYTYIPIFYRSEAIKSATFNKLKSCSNSGLFYHSSIEEVYMPIIQTLGTSAFQDCSALHTAYLPNAILDSWNFYGCKKLTKLEFNNTNIGTNTFQNSGLNTLILRNSSVATLKNISAFYGTPIASGTGYIYVPDDLVESYKVATNWSTYADQIKPLSEYVEEEV